MSEAVLMSVSAASFVNMHKKSGAYLCTVYKTAEKENKIKKL